VLIGLICFAIALRRYMTIKEALLAFDRQEYLIDLKGDLGKVRLRSLSFVLVVVGVFLFMIGWFAYRAVRHGLEDYFPS